MTGWTLYSQPERERERDEGKWDQVPNRHSIVEQDLKKRIGIKQYQDDR